MKTLGVGIVGLGLAGEAHLSGYRAVRGAKVKSICSRKEYSENEWVEKVGREVTHVQDFEKLLADPEIDIIDICTPHPLHVDLAVAAAREKKHLLIEKPVALSWEDCLKIQKSVAENKVKANVGFVCRYSQQFTLTKSIIDQGLLGEIHYAEVDYFHGIDSSIPQFEWNIKKEYGGSSLLTAGCHSLDILLFLLGKKPEEVMSHQTKSFSSEFSRYEYPTTSVNFLKFDGGKVLGKVTSCIDALQPYYFHVHLIGSEGSLLDNKFYSKKLKGMRKDKWSTLETSLIDSGDAIDHPYTPLFQDFVEQINTGKKSLTDLETALETHRVIFAADRSAQSGSPVKL